MKRIMIGALAMVLVLFSGCKPTEEEINKAATAIGYAAGLIANETGIKDEARNAVVTILNEVRSCVPEKGQSFVDAWTPVIKEKVDALVAAGKLDAATGELVKSVAILAAKGVDYLFDIRFPKAKKYEELVAAGVSGAVDGFLTAFKPVDGARSAAKVECDKEAYDWFKKNLK